MNERYTVYKHICPNGKVYIGITSKPVKERWRCGYGYRQNAHFWKAIVKYGWNNIQHEILYIELTKEEAEQKEVELIAKYRSNENEYGYNRDSGGTCNKTHSVETKEKIRRKLQGHSVSDTTRKKMAKIKIEAFGETHTLNEWEAITGIKTDTILARIKRYDIPIEEALTAKELRGRKISKAVVQYNKNLIIINTFKSTTEAERKTGIHHIWACCNGDRKTAGGYIWKFKE